MIVGIDTSCYTTSLAVIDETTGDIVLDSRRLLKVKSGEKGLRQSEAIFQHLQHLPELLDETFFGIKVTAVSTAITPRPVPDSYLPVFKVGSSYGETMAKLLGVPLIKTSHQEGHIRAGTYNQPKLNGNDFLAWHISGGTTELLLVKPAKIGFAIQKIGGSSDLHVGQFIDRIGVALGTDFPAGPHLEKMALNSNTDDMLPVATQGLMISFSGPASAAERLVSAEIDSDLARKIFNSISKALLRVTVQAVKEFKITQVLLVGGVASSRIIRENLNRDIGGTGIELIFGAKELSSDNAVGVGLIGFDYVRKGYFHE